PSSMADALDRWAAKQPKANEGDALDRYARKQNIPSFPGAQRKADLPKDLPQRIGEAALTSLPYVGATVGSLFAGPEFLPAIGYATAGGLAGSAAEQGIRTATGDEPPQSFQEAATRVGKQGLEQGATELGGQ